MAVKMRVSRHSDQAIVSKPFCRPIFSLLGGDSADDSDGDNATWGDWVIEEHHNVQRVAIGGFR